MRQVRKLLYESVGCWLSDKVGWLVLHIYVHTLRYICAYVAIRTRVCSLVRGGVAANNSGESVECSVG